VGWVGAWVGAAAGAAAHLAGGRHHPERRQLRCHVWRQQRAALGRVVQRLHAGHWRLQARRAQGQQRVEIQRGEVQRAAGRLRLPLLLLPLLLPSPPLLARFNPLLLRRLCAARWDLLQTLPGARGVLLVPRLAAACLLHAGLVAIQLVVVLVPAVAQQVLLLFNLIGIVR
jgi:hypothetical protein